MSLRSYLAIIVKWSWLAILVTTGLVLVAYLYTTTLTPIYQTSTDVLVGRFDQSSDVNQNSAFLASQVAQSHALLAKQQPILEAVANETGYPGGWQALFFTAQVSTSGGQLVDISVTDQNPAMAKRVADALAQELIKQSPINAQQQRSQEQRSFIETQLTQLESRIKKGQADAISLEAQSALENDPEQLGVLTEQLEKVEARVEKWQQSYADLSALITRQDSGSYLSILAPAQLPSKPISPNVQLYLIIAAMLGLIISGAIIFAIEYLDETVKDANDAQTQLNVPTLGTITRIQDIKRPADQVVTITQPRSPISEAYRVLRTNLRFSGIENPNGALLVTSSGPGEGKSTTAANLATTIAQSGKRVILLDCDLRRPSLQNLFNVSNDVGLTDLFLDDAPELDRVLKPTAIPGLRLLTTGTIPPNPSEILDSKRMTDILSALRSQSDMVVIDSSPALLVADASILGSRCSGAILVVDSGKTRIDVARRALNTLKQANVKVLGTVINKLSTRRTAGYNYHYYNYYGGKTSKSGKTPKSA
ncbi:MAG: polysaccharide biosynthesis tyrosine autokinase [Anaerolineae bacterium]|nr:polysaccharide biosynthesis tyrosine autokinase [Anaerolineae bacterium]